MFAIFLISERYFSKLGNADIDSTVHDVSAISYSSNRVTTTRLAAEHAEKQSKLLEENRVLR